MRPSSSPRASVETTLAVLSTVCLVPFTDKANFMTQPKTTKSSESSQPAQAKKPKRLHNGRRRSRRRKSTQSIASTTTNPTQTATRPIANQAQSPKTQPRSQTRGRNGDGSRRKNNKAVREYSAGGVVFRSTDKGVEFLLIEDLKGRWSVPKGHVESGETLEQTALREIGEETGLHNTRIHEKLDKVHFFYRFEGKLIFMTTYIFLIEANDPEEPIVVEESEGIVGARWCPAKTAQQVRESKALKNLMERSLAIIEQRQLA